MSHSLRLNRKIYNHPALETALAAFGELAKISMEVDGEHYRLTFEEIDPDVEDVLVREFANYTLAETIENRH